MLPIWFNYERFNRMMVTDMPMFSIWYPSWTFWKPTLFLRKEWGGEGCVWSSVITVVTKQTHLIFYSDHIVGIAAPLIAFQWHCIKIATRSFISLLPGPSAYCSMPILLNIWMERSDKIYVIWHNIFIAKPIGVRSVERKAKEML